jgi:argininosuccinate synthase
VTLDKETAHAKERVMPAYAELVYNGYWFSKKRIKLQKIIDKKRKQVAGDVVLGLYKGNITILSRRTKNKGLFSKKSFF